MTAGVDIGTIRDEARRRGVRWTSQRQAIVDVFLSADGHLSVEELTRRVRVSDPTVASATVYRTINLLVELGVAQKQHFGSATASFERAVGRAHHDHLVCLACGGITEFERDDIERLQDSVAAEHGFKLTSHRMELYGICRSCQSSGRMPVVVPDRG